MVEAAAYCSPTSMDIGGHVNNLSKIQIYMDHLRGSFVVHWLHFNPPGGNVAQLYVHKKQAINIGNIS